MRVVSRRKLLLGSWCPSPPRLVGFSLSACLSISKPNIVALLSSLLTYCHWAVAWSCQWIPMSCLFKAMPHLVEEEMFIGLKSTLYPDSHCRLCLSVLTLYKHTEQIHLLFLNLYISHCEKQLEVRSNDLRWHELCWPAWVSVDLSKSHPPLCPRLCSSLHLPPQMITLHLAPHQPPRNDYV